MVAALLGDAEIAHRHSCETATSTCSTPSTPSSAGRHRRHPHRVRGAPTGWRSTGPAGLGFADARLTLDPVLPPTWSSLSYPVAWRGRRFTVTIDRAGDGDPRVTITAAANDEAVGFAVRGIDVLVPHGSTVTV